MIVGFTGTREGMTPEQAKAVEAALVRLGATELHHGDCVGSDAQAHAIARRLGLRVVVHPPRQKDLRAFCVGDEIRPGRGYLERDRIMVAETEALVGAPKAVAVAPGATATGGTWYTIREARKRQRPAVICRPDGSTTEERMPLEMGPDGGVIQTRAEEPREIAGDGFASVRQFGERRAGEPPRDGRPCTPAERGSRAIGDAVAPAGASADGVPIEEIDAIAGRIALHTPVSPEEAERLTRAVVVVLRSGVDVWTLTERVWILGLERGRIGRRDG